jgi:hypothetical protein
VLVGVRVGVGVIVGVGLGLVAVRVGVGVGVWSTQRASLSHVASWATVQLPQEPLIGAAQLAKHWQQSEAPAGGPGELNSHRRQWSSSLRPCPVGQSHAGQDC